MFIWWNGISTPAPHASVGLCLQLVECNDRTKNHQHAGRYNFTNRCTTDGMDRPYYTALFDQQPNGHVQKIFPGRERGGGEFRINHCMRTTFRVYTLPLNCFTHLIKTVCIWMTLVNISIKLSGGWIHSGSSLKVFIRKQRML